MNILMSGGFGFIGSYLIPHLLSKGVRVGVIARRVPDSFHDLAKTVDCHIHDLSHPTDLRVTRQYDCFVHLAGALHSVPSTSADALSRSLDVTRHCLSLCRANGISRFVHFSTFQVYGRDEGFVDEETPVTPRNDYATAHQRAEELVRASCGDDGLEYAVLRPTNGYGFSQHADVHRWSLVPSCFCRSAVEHGGIVLRTSGLQEKDFIHLEHIASLIHGICASFDRFKNRPTNLASGSSQSIVDVANLVKGIYERTFGRPCALRVLSDSPPRAEPLVVNTARTSGIAYVPADDVSLAAEIRKTFTFLTSQGVPA